MVRSITSLSACILAAACVSAPEPPPEPAEVSALAAQYTSLTATLQPAVTGTILAHTLPTRGVLGALSGLRFMRNIVSDATVATSDSTDLELEVQGSALAHAPCPGWGQQATPDEASRGYIEVMIGVEDSRVQRAFAGRAVNCKFVTAREPRSNVTVTMNLQIDLGGDLEFGESADTLLIRATDVSGAIDGVALGLGAQVFSFRFSEDDAIETLIDLASMRLGVSGTLLLALRSDGVWALKTRTGEWACGSAGSGPCVLD